MILLNNFQHELVMLMHVVFAAILSGTIGFERKRQDKPAGIKTHMIVGGSVALLVSLGELIVQYFYEMGFVDNMRFDPTRIIQAIVVGISFIGAGIVLQIEKEQKIKYLTTAATILFSSGIGIAVALRNYVLAVGVTLFILFINYLISKIEEKLV